MGREHWGMGGQKSCVCNPRPHTEHATGTSVVVPLRERERERERREEMLIPCYSIALVRRRLQKIPGGKKFDTIITNISGAVTTVTIVVKYYSILRGNVLPFKIHNFSMTESGPTLSLPTSN